MKSYRMEEISCNKSAAACAPWIMDLQTSPQHRRNYKFDNLRSNVNNISPKLHKQKKMRPWQNITRSKSGGKDGGLAECKAKTYECGDVLISRDVVCDDFNERGSIEGKLKSQKCHTKQLQQESEKSKNPMLEKKANVSVSSELPVAKSKWGVKLRHVITRDASADDKSKDAKQPFYNFRKLSKIRPRSASETPKKTEEEEVIHLWRSLSTNDVLESQYNKDSNKHAHTTKFSVFKRMKSFESKPKLKSNVKGGIVNVVENTTSRGRNTTKHLSLEDLLNLDKQNLSIDVKKAEDRSDRIISELNDVEYDSRKCLQSIMSTDITRNVNIKTQDKSKSADNSPKVSNSKRFVGNLCPEKLNIFGKRKHKQAKRAMSLEELLKLDEQNLSVDVIDKNKHENIDHRSPTKFTNCKDSGTGGNQYDFFKSDRQRSLDKTKISNTNLDKKCIATKHCEVQAVDLFLQQEKKSNCPSPVNPDYFEPKLLFDNEVSTSNSNTKYSKLGQIILSNDMRDEHSMVKNEVISASHANTDTNQDVRTSELTNYSGRKSECTRQDSVAKHNTPGQIILNDDNTVKNGTVEIKGKYEAMCNVNNKLKTGGNSALVNLADKVGDAQQVKTLKRTEYQERNNQKTIETSKVDNSYEHKINSYVDHKSINVIGKKHDCIDQVVPSTHSNEITNVKMEKQGKRKTDVKGSVLPTDSCAINNNQIYNDKETGASENNVSEKGNGNDNNSLRSTIGTLEKLTKNTPERNIPDREVIGQQPEVSCSAPINRKVGRLIIMTGEQRNEQLKNKHLQFKATKYNGPSSIEDLKKCHKEGFSLTFMSNELEDDGVRDYYPIPEIVYNGSVTGLKSMMHRKKNKESKNVRFTSSNLVTIHSYPSEESWTINDNDQDGENTELEDSILELTSSTQSFPNLKSYEPSYSFDFGSVIQRERQRFDSMDTVGADKSETKLEPTFDYDEEGEHFNSHQDQDGGHALLF